MLAETNLRSLGEGLGLKRAADVTAGRLVAYQVTVSSKSSATLSHDSESWGAEAT